MSGLHSMRKPLQQPCRCRPETFPARSTIFIISGWFSCYQTQHLMNVVVMPRRCSAKKVPEKTESRTCQRHRECSLERDWVLTLVIEGYMSSCCSVVDDNPRSLFRQPRDGGSALLPTSLVGSKG
ncbi:hypothetical protein ASPBRDRAFT_675261 [Aspergillus brasiliensis CBS 101740]|uniref:Uncharacterized protein n=1 Tax=Aspergillus brasiliensis (strain CBS 101740 / IMI 381727 / IBT 21946) TaxID=767769 RepID=A0A1L9UKG8_ASPBC|nr:hypothetical protein ASPBRDRAFT_675261 [Aspergillus brasiliensis CBS 101740]